MAPRLPATSRWAQLSHTGCAVAAAPASSTCLTSCSLRSAGTESLTAISCAAAIAFETVRIAMSDPSRRHTHTAPWQAVLANSDRSHTLTGHRDEPHDCSIGELAGGSLAAPDRPGLGLAA